MLVYICTQQCQLLPHTIYISIWCVSPKSSQTRHLFNNLASETFHIPFSEGCVSENLTTCWHGSTVITAPTISLQGLSHFFWECVSTCCSVIDIVFWEGCVSAYLDTFWHWSTVITALTITLQALSHFSWWCSWTWCGVIVIAFSEGCVSEYQTTFWHWLTGITALQGLSHFS